MKKREINTEKLKKRYFALKIAFAAVLLLLAGSIYFNFNYTVFKILIAGNYIFTDGLNDVFIEQLGGQNYKPDGNFFRNFDEMTISVVSEKIRQKAEDRYTYLYTPPQLAAEDAATEELAKETEIKELTPETVYLRIPNVSEYSQKYIFGNKDKLKGYKNLIIDLQSNHGGDINVLYSFAELFLDKGQVIGSEIARSGLFTKTVRASKAKELDYDKIVILINGGTASAAEGFSMSLRENLANVTLIGTQSYGKGIGQITVPLLGGYAVKATVIRVQTPLGNSINKTGITPDIFYDEDDAVGAALKFLGTS